MNSETALPAASRGAACSRSLLIVQLDHAEEIRDGLFDFCMPRPVLQLCMRLLEEKLELLFDPSDHLVVLVQDAALAEEKR